MSDELSAATIDAREKLEKRLADISKITEINDLILLIVEKNLESVKKDLVEIGRGGGVMKKIGNALKLLNSTTSNPKVIEQKQIIREQILVLYTGSLESYLSETIRLIGNTQPDFFKFRSENENISFNQSMLRNSFTLGDAILEHIENKNYSFQDLKSTLDVFDNYLGISLDLADYQDQLILMAAARHIIVHNNSIIDRKFIKQVRNTKFAKEYKLEQSIKVDDNLVDDSRGAIENFADQIVSAIINRDEE